jgi:nickel-dependent lactate racemase
MIASQSVASPGQLLSEGQILKTLHEALAGQFRNQRVLALIPDHTRSLPLPFLFHAIIEVLHDVKQLDFMVALGTHPPLSEERINKLVGITPEERRTTFKHIGLSNHAWNTPSALASLGAVEQDELKRIAGDYWHSSLPGKVDIRINRAAFEHDHILVLAPTFPHEVTGFSGGTKYLFPDVSGAEMINATHWLGALAGVVRIIGVKNMPVRAMIHAAAARLKTPITLIALMVEGHDLSGLLTGDPISAWSAAADLSAQRHLRAASGGGKPLARKIHLRDWLSHLAIFLE